MRTSKWRGVKLKFLRFQQVESRFVAVFDIGLGEEDTWSEGSLQTRITNLTQNWPGYDPGPDQTVLDELREKNKELLGRT
jgi:hypothetical protein